MLGTQASARKIAVAENADGAEDAVDFNQPLRLEEIPAMQDSRTCWAIIVAAGRGTRIGRHTDGPKQYRRIGGEPVIARTLRAFATHPEICGIVAVIHPDDEDLFESAMRTVSCAFPVRIVHGGPTRQLSCLAGLEALDDKDVRSVLIHDAARPFVTHALIDRVVALLDGGARAVLPAVPVSDTLKRADAEGYVSDTVPRDNLHAAQTPQGFAFPDILAAHRLAAETGRTDFTDDCAVMEWAGHRVRLCEGAAENIKITKAEDIEMAEMRLAAAPPADIRTGNGYDVHRLVPGSHVTLCGIDISHHMRLDGHSDADVALHALTDALLATCGAGDIGDHFPPSDPQWKGAASDQFLRHAAKIVAEHGGTVLNADVTLIAEAPKIGPHRDEMRRNLSDILGIDITRCSVKATTNERLGFAGRSEGIAAIATASVAYGGRHETHA